MVERSCNPVQLLAMAIREASFIPSQQLTAIEMILTSVNREQQLTPRVCNPVQWVDIDIILASVSLMQYEKSNNCSPVHIDMILASVNWPEYRLFNDCSLAQWVDIDMILASVSVMQH